MKRNRSSNRSIVLAACIIFALCSSYSAVFAQQKWYNPMDAGFPVMQNQGWSKELSSTFVRLPDRAQAEVRGAVWNLSRQAAGLAIYFYSNAPEIRVRYGVKGGIQMPHMPATGVSGIDLYRIDSHGGWHNCSGNYAFRDTVQYTFSDLTKNEMHTHGFEYRLYLPLYNQVEWLEIGVDEGSELVFIPQEEVRPIVLYGTSIAQGACASRPGMAWGNILNRALDYPLINLGFSGYGQLEKGVLSLINELDARLYILDCLPNLTSREEKEIYQLVVDAVRQIRAQHDTPILLVEHAGYSNEDTNYQKKVESTRVNKASKEAYETLLSEGIKDLHYLARADLNMPADGWVDYTHPSDYGMQVQAKAVEKKVREILHLPVGEIATTRPVMQRREPDNYEWRNRHRNILKTNRTNPPRAVIFGNSITHFWGDETDGPRKRGEDSWDRTMRVNGFRNMGYGYDRIENVLWRVYHDELAGYNAEKVVVAIGTNNIDGNTPAEIVEGIRFLMAAIQERQPAAQLEVWGIYPRRDREALVKSINKELKSMAKKNGYTFKDPGIKLLLKSGKIDESLFSDGLHPNEEGYRRVESAIK